MPAQKSKITGLKQVTIEVDPALWKRSGLAAKEDDLLLRDFVAQALREKLIRRNQAPPREAHAHLTGAVR